MYVLSDLRAAFTSLYVAGSVDNPFKSIGKSIGLQVNMLRDLQFIFLAGMERDRTVDACMYSDQFVVLLFRPTAADNIY